MLISLPLPQRFMRQAGRRFRRCRNTRRRTVSRIQSSGGSDLGSSGVVDLELDVGSSWTYVAEFSKLNREVVLCSQQLHRRLIDDDMNSQVRDEVVMARKQNLTSAWIYAIVHQLVVHRRV